LTTVVTSLTCWRSQSLGKHTAGRTDGQHLASNCSNQQHRRRNAVHRCDADSSI